MAAAEAPPAALAASEFVTGQPCSALPAPANCERELRVAQSLAWTVPERAGSGLINLGNTCFLNSVLQLLCHTPPLASLALQRVHTASCSSDGCAVCVLLRRIEVTLRSQTATAPRDIVECMRSLPALRRLAHGRQEDAHEALRLTLEALHHSGLRAKGFPTYGPGAAPGPHRAPTLVEAVFGGTILSRVTCQSCKAHSDTHDSFEDLSLELVHGVTSVETGLKAFMRSETLDGADSYKCENCKQLSAATKRITIEKAPNILVLHLKRFKAGGYGKVNTTVSFGERLSLAGLVTALRKQPPLYRLYAVVVHSGWSMGSGHYYAYTRDAANRWSVADDSRVTKVTLQEVLRTDAYLLAYIREPPPVRPHAEHRKEIQAALVRGDSALAGPACKRKASELSGANIAAVRASLFEIRKRLRSANPAASLTAASLACAWEERSMADVLAYAPAGLRDALEDVARSAILAPST